jgi:hypothetical protein
MIPLTIASAGSAAEILLIDFVAVFLTIAIIWILWYLARKIYPNDVGDLQFLLTFVVGIVPFVMLIYFGLAAINYEAMAAWSGWQARLPFKEEISPPIASATVFYIGQVMWLSWRWRKLNRGSR